MTPACSFQRVTAIFCQFAADSYTPDTLHAQYRMQQCELSGNGFLECKSILLSNPLFSGYILFDSTSTSSATF